MSKKLTTEFSYLTNMIEKVKPYKAVLHPPFSSDSSE